jgi:hypothetical protein
MKTLGRILLLILFFVALLLIMNSCVTYNRCVQKYGRTGDTVKLAVRVPVHDTVRVVTKADSLQDRFDVDSVLALVDTLRHTSASGKLQIAFWKDKYTRQLHYKARVLSDTIYVIRRDTVRVTVACPPGSVLTNKGASGVRALWNGFQLFAAWALLVLLFVLMFLKRIKNLFR